MKKLFYLGFALVLAMGAGCALTNYELITDNDQVRNGSSGAVNTNGKAHIFESSQVALIWPDGTDESLWFVDQNAAGDRVLTTYVNFSVGPLVGGTDPTFHDDFYCNPDWNGCAVITAQDPEVGDVNIYDYKYNPNCPAARSIYYLLSTYRYYGECGRGIQDAAALVMMGQPKDGGLFYLMTPANTNVLLTSRNDGTTTAMSLMGDISITATGDARPKVRVDASTPWIGSWKGQLATYSDVHGPNNEITVQFNGLSKKFNVELFEENLRAASKKL